ncbi:MAG TPA: Dabb family protein [Longimicrobiaceae bacterium]
MFIHSVYFWLDEKLSDEKRAQFEEQARALTHIESVRHGWLGTPAPTDRPIIERSYSYALTVVFDDEAAHDVYQEHPVHDRFRDECGSFWTRVLIYDSVA